MVQFVPQAFGAWYDFAKGLGFTDLLSAEDGFRTSLVTGEPWANMNKCGVYFWIADDGETYVGETVNARSRLITHFRRHPDIRLAGFQLVPREMRKAREKELIKLVEASVFPTRNIKLAFNTRTFVPFDQFISPSELSTFLHSEVIDDDPDQWQDLPLLIQKQAGRFQQLNDIPDKDEILEALVIYLWCVLPRPRLLENHFWSVTLFPGSHILRVNAGQQEIFTIRRAEDGALWARMLTLRPFGTRPEGPMYSRYRNGVLMPLGSCPLGSSLSG